MQTILDNCMTMLAARRHTDIRSNGVVVFSHTPAGFEHITLFQLDEKLSTMDVKDVIRAAIENDFSQCMLVYDRLTSVTTTVSWCKNLVEVELFPVDSLLFPILDHELVPVHQILTDAEHADFCKKFPKMDLPKIRETDPVMRYFGWRAGQIVRIVQKKTGEISYSKIIH